MKVKKVKYVLIQWSGDQNSDSNKLPKGHHTVLKISDNNSLRIAFSINAAEEGALGLALYVAQTLADSIYVESYANYREFLEKTVLPKSMRALLSA